VPAYRTHTSAYRTHTSAYVSIRQYAYRTAYRTHTSAYASVSYAYVSVRQLRCTVPAYRTHTSAYVSMRTVLRIAAYVSVSYAYVSVRQLRCAVPAYRTHTSAYVSVRQHTSAYVSIRQHACVSFGDAVRMQHAVVKRKVAEIALEARSIAYSWPPPPRSPPLHTSAYVSIRQRLPWKHVASPTPGRHRREAPHCIRQRMSAYVSVCQEARGIAYSWPPPPRSPPLHTSAYVSIRQRMSAYVSIRQHTSAYASTRQHTALVVEVRQVAADRGLIRQRM
jgi:hypothetical protein